MMRRHCFRRYYYRHDDVSFATCFAMQLAYTLIIFDTLLSP